MAIPTPTPIPTLLLCEVGDEVAEAPADENDDAGDVTVTVGPEGEIDVGVDAGGNKSKSSLSNSPGLGFC